MSHELKCNGNVQDLQTELVHFMMHNPQSEANGTEYEDFLADIVEQGDFMNADTAQPDERDKMIAQIECFETRKHARWELYLHKLEHERQWRDNITLQGLAERFNVKIHIISSETDNIPTHGPNSGISKADVYIGHILQRHYVALDRYYEVTNHQRKHDRSQGKDSPISATNKTDSTSTQSQVKKIVIWLIMMLKIKLLWREMLSYVVFHMKVDFLTNILTGQIK